MISWLIFNAKDDEVHCRKFKDASDARHWIINHLDLSKAWSMVRKSQVWRLIK